MAKKEVKPWTLGDLGSGIGQGYEWLKTHTLTGGTPAKDPRNVSSHPGADKLFDPPKLTSDDKRSTARKFIDEVSGATVGGNSFRYKKKAPAGGANPPKGGGGGGATKSVPTPTARPKAPVAGAAKAATAGYRPRAVQSWRGGDVPGQVRYDPGTKPNYTKKQRSQGVHDTKGLKWFRGKGD